MAISQQNTTTNRIPWLFRFSSAFDIVFLLSWLLTTLTMVGFFSSYLRGIIGFELWHCLVFAVPMITGAIAIWKTATSVNLSSRIWSAAYLLGYVYALLLVYREQATAIFPDMLACCLICLTMLGIESVWRRKSTTLNLDCKSRSLKLREKAVRSYFLLGAVFFAPLFVALFFSIELKNYYSFVAVILLLTWFGLPLFICLEHLSVDRLRVYDSQDSTRTIQISTFAVCFTISTALLACLVIYVFFYQAPNLAAALCLAVLYAAPIFNCRFQAWRRSYREAKEKAGKIIFWGPENSPIFTK